MQRARRGNRLSLDSRSQAAHCTFNFGQLGHCVIAVE
jgi:hypothetical protein